MVVLLDTSSAIIDTEEANLLDVNNAPFWRPLASDKEEHYYENNSTHRR